MSFEYVMLSNGKKGTPHIVSASSALCYVNTPPYVNLEVFHKVFVKQGTTSSHSGSLVPSLNAKENLSLVQTPDNG